MFYSNTPNLGLNPSLTVLWAFCAPRVGYLSRGLRVSSYANVVHSKQTELDFILCIPV